MLVNYFYGILAPRSSPVRRVVRQRNSMENASGQCFSPEECIRNGHEECAPGDLAGKNVAMAIHRCEQLKLREGQHP